MATQALTRGRTTGRHLGQACGMLSPTPVARDWRAFAAHSGVSLTLHVHQLGQVFNEAMLPAITYVPPAEARRLRGSLATPGKHVTLVGPSGSGKSTVAHRTLDELGLGRDRVYSLNGRSHAQAASILEVFGAEFGLEPVARAIEPRLRSYDLIVIDDVHHLSLEARTELASHLKLWHERGIRLFMIGIAKTSEAILGQDPELAIRNDTWHLGTQSDEFMHDLMTKGERALNIRFDADSRATAIEAAQGSPSIFQAICRITCDECDVMQTVDVEKQLSIDLPAIRAFVVQQYDGRYLNKIVGLARGRRQARSVHDTFYAIIEHVARSRKHQISKDELYHAVLGNLAGSADARQRDRVRSSFYRAMKALPVVIEENSLSDILIFENGTLTIDDPVFRFYLDHLEFSRVRSQVNIRRLGYEYDVAVSFAGSSRDVVAKLVNVLTERGLEVFYDFDQQARLWGKDLREELARVYGQQAQFMIVCLSDDYPERDWPAFELQIGKDAATKRTEDYLLPLVVGATRPAIVGLPETVGHISLSDRSLDEIAELVSEKVHSLPSTDPGASSEDPPSTP